MKASEAIRTLRTVTQDPRDLETLDNLLIYAGFMDADGRLRDEVDQNSPTTMRELAENYVPLAGRNH